MTREELDAIRTRQRELEQEARADTYGWEHDTIIALLAEVDRLREAALQTLVTIETLRVQLDAAHKSLDGYVDEVARLRAENEAMKAKAEEAADDAWERDTYGD